MTGYLPERFLWDNNNALELAEVNLDLRKFRGSSAPKKDAA